MEGEELLERSLRIARAQGRRLRLGDQDCQDAAGDVVEKYLTVCAQTAEPANAEAWLEVVTRNKLIDRVRVLRVGVEGHARHRDALAGTLRLARGMRSPSMQVAQARFLQEVLSLVRQEDAELLRQRYVDGATAADLAQQMNVTVNTIDQRTTRAKRALREALAARPDLVDELRRGHHVRF